MSTPLLKQEHSNMHSSSLPYLYFSQNRQNNPQNSQQILKLEQDLNNLTFEELEAYSTALNRQMYKGRGVQNLIETCIANASISAQLYGLVNIKKILVKSSQTLYNRTLIDSVLLPYLFALVDSSQNPLFLKEVIAILSKIIERGISHHQLLRDRAVPFFVGCLQTDNWDILTSAAFAIQTATSNPCYIKAVVAMEGVAKLLEVTSQIGDKVLMKCCCETVIAYQNSLTGSKAQGFNLQAGRLLQIGILDCILQELRLKKACTSINRRQIACLLLNYVVSCSKEGVSLLLESKDLLPALLDHFAGDFGPVREVLCQLFANLSIKGSFKQVLVFYKRSRIVRYFNTCLTFNNINIVQSALSGLLKIIRLSQKFKHLTNNTNVLATDFVAIQGRRSLRQAYSQYLEVVQSDITALLELLPRQQLSCVKQEEKCIVID